MMDITTFFAGLGPIIWKFSLGFLIVVGLVAYALLTPPTFLPRTKTWALLGAAFWACIIVAYSVGIRNEDSRWKAKWDAAEKASVKRGSSARVDSERAYDRGVRDPRDTDE